MCRQFQLDVDRVTLSDQFKHPLPDKQLLFQGKHIYCPGQQILALTQTDRGKLWYDFHWGLIPHWYDPTQHHLKFPYNARLESLTIKPMFRKIVQTRRCLIPVSSFYEGPVMAAGQQTYTLTSTDHNLFAFAGLWDTWQNPQTGALTHSATIITKPTALQFKYIHHRFPVVLLPNDYDSWLSPSHLEQALQLCQQQGIDFLNVVKTEVI